LIMNATMMWGNNVLAFIALIVLGWGLPFAWAGFIVFALPVAGLSLWRFRAGNWRERAYVPIG
jgi:Na+-driven multidrug efflux pump